MTEDDDDDDDFVVKKMKKVKTPVTNTKLTAVSRKTNVAATKKTAATVKRAPPKAPPKPVFSASLLAGRNKARFNEILREQGVTLAMRKKKG